MRRDPRSHDPAHPYASAGPDHGPEMSIEQIRERAHAIWIAEGKPEGREIDHWLRARRELEHEAASSR